MPRIVTALFESRGEAESGRARLAAAVKVESSQVIGLDTAGALVGLPIETKALESLREGLKRGDHVVVARVARGAEPERIVDVLSEAAAEGPSREGAKLFHSIGQYLRGRSTPERTIDLGVECAVPDPELAVRPASDVEDAALPAHPTTAEPAPATAPPGLEREPPAPEFATPEDSSEEARIGEAQIVRASGHVAPVGEGRGPFESRTPARRLSEEEVRAGGLLKDRVIEVGEMREEPVITREVFMREEVLIRKTVNQRSDTMHDTVRRTDVETEELHARE